MPTGFESSGLNTLVEAIKYLLDRSKKNKRKQKGELALESALRELLSGTNDFDTIEIAIENAEAAGVRSKSLKIVQRMLDDSQSYVSKKKQKTSKKKRSKKKVSKKKRSKKKVSKKKRSKKKASKKKRSKKKASKKKRSKKKNG